MDLTWAEFEKVDMRVGVVVDAKDFPEARRPAYRLWIDFGPLGVKRSSAQITTHYRPDELIGRRVVGVVNFPPKHIGPSCPRCSCWAPTTRPARWCCSNPTAPSPPAQESANPAGVTLTRSPVV